MPVIHVRSLPPAAPQDMHAVLAGVSHDFADGTGVALRHITATWEFLQPGHYLVGGVGAVQQPQGSHPLLVELVTPDLFGADAVRRMLECLAASLSRQTGVAPSNVFIRHYYSRSGSVFDGGEVVSW